MKAGLTPTMARLLRRPNPPVHHVFDVITVGVSDIMDTYDEWGDADALTGLTRQNDGTLILAESNSAHIAHTSGTDQITDLDGISPYHVAKVVWNDSSREIHRVKAYLDPDADSSGQLVTKFVCRLFRLAEYDDTITGGLTLQPISGERVVENHNSAGLATFDFTTGVGPYPRVGDPPLSGGSAFPKPVTYIFIAAYDDNGAAVGNVAWYSDSGQSEPKTQNSHDLYGIELVDNPGGRYLETATDIDVPRVTIEGDSYSAATVTYTSNPITLSAQSVTGSDTFTEASNTDLDAHSPDSGITSWEYNTPSGSSDVIVDATEDVARFTHNTTVYVRSTNNVIGATYKWYIECRVERNSVDGTTEAAGLYGYADSSVTAANIVGEGFQVFLQRGSSANDGDIKYTERNSSGTIVQSGTLSTVSWITTTDHFLRCEVDGLVVTVFDKASSGDAWTTTGTFTLTLDVRDSDHLRAGLVGNDGSQASSSEPFVDDFAVGALDDDFDVELVGTAATPAGTTVTFEIHNGSSWVEFYDGDFVATDNSDIGGADLTSVAKAATYDMRATLTPNTGGDTTPILYALGAQEVTRTTLYDTVVSSDARWRVDPVTLKSNITDMVISILHEGVRDFNDYVTRTLVANDLGDINVRMFWGHEDLARQHWLHVESFILEDYIPDEGAVHLMLLSPLQLVRGLLPVPTESGGSYTETPFAQTNTNIDDAWTNILAETTLASRYIGQGPTDTTTVSKTVVGSDAKTELDAVSFVAGVATITNQGRVSVADFYGDVGGTVEFFPSDAIDEIDITPGFRLRIPEYVVDYDWNESGNRFDGVVLSINSNALTKLGKATIDPPLRIPTEIAQWIPTEAIAETVGGRMVQAFGTGLIEWRFRSTRLYPELHLGDSVVVETERFLAKDPISGRELKGRLWALARIVECHANAQDFAVWVQGYADIFAVHNSVANTGATATIRLSYAEFVTVTTGTADTSNNDLRSNDGNQLAARAVTSVPPFAKQLVSIKQRTYANTSVDVEVQTTVSESADGTLNGLSLDLRNGNQSAGSWINTESTGTDDVTANAAIVVSVSLVPDGTAADARFLWVELGFR